MGMDMNDIDQCNSVLSTVDMRIIPVTENKYVIEVRNEVCNRKYDSVKDAYFDAIGKIFKTEE